MDNTAYKTKYSTQEIMNMSFDDEFSSLVFQPIATPMAMKLTESGDITYIAKAPVGSAQSDAVWQVKKIDNTTGVVITWADGDGNYDNVATDLSSLSYS